MREKNATAAPSAPIIVPINPTRSPLAPVFTNWDECFAGTLLPDLVDALKPEASVDALPALLLPALPVSALPALLALSALLDSLVLF